MRWLLATFVVALVVAALVWFGYSRVPMKPTLPEIGPGARVTVPLDLSSPSDGGRD